MTYTGSEKIDSRVCTWVFFLISIMVGAELPMMELQFDLSLAHPSFSNLASQSRAKYILLLIGIVIVYEAFDDLTRFVIRCATVQLDAYLPAWLYNGILLALESDYY